MLSQRNDSHRLSEFETEYGLNGHNIINMNKEKKYFNEKDACEEQEYQKQLLEKMKYFDEHPDELNI